MRSGEREGKRASLVCATGRYCSSCVAVITSTTSSNGTRPWTEGMITWSPMELHSVMMILNILA